MRKKNFMTALAAAFCLTASALAPGAAVLAEEETAQETDAQEETSQETAEETTEETIAKGNACKRLEISYKQTSLCRKSRRKRNGGLV